MNTRTTLAVVLCLSLLLLCAGPALAQPDHRAALTPLPTMPQPALAFRSGGHLAAFYPGRACLATLDHALCVEFVDGAGSAPRQAAAAAGLAATGLDGAAPLGEVRYDELWPGIDLTYSGARGLAKATYTLAPGADPGRIRLHYSLPAALQPDGSLRFEPPSDRGALTESAPVAWQDVGGRRVAVEVGFDLAADGEVGFRLGAYDRRYALTIDPTYEWHTFYGSDWDWDEASSVAVDGAGNVYVAGGSGLGWLGDGFTSPLNDHWEASPGFSDLVVVKLGSDGAYQWHTFYGASMSYDTAYGLALDAAGNAYVAGLAQGSWDGPSGEPPIHPYSSDDNFVILKLDSNGAYQWHTYYGAGGWAWAIDLDGAGGVYVAGDSDQSWPGDMGQQPIHAHSGYSNEGTVLKLNTDGDYQWHTFYETTAAALAVDGAGGIYVGGASPWMWWGDGGQAPIHPFTIPNALTVLKLNGSGAYQWHTFYGSGAWTSLEDLAVDLGGSVYAVGTSPDPWLGDGGAPPIHPHSGTPSNIAVLKLNSGGAYQWHTFYHGEATSSSGHGVAVDGAGNLVVVSSATQSWLGDDGSAPLHPWAAYLDIEVLKLSSNGAYRWHTFYGGTDIDTGWEVAVDAAGDIYAAGSSGLSWQGDGGADALHPATESTDLTVLKLAGDVQAVIDPVEGGTLVFTDNQGLTTTLQVPPGAVPVCTELLYTSLMSPTAPLPPGDEYAGHAFWLHAYPCGGQYRVYLPLVLRQWSAAPAGRARPASPPSSPAQADPVFSVPVTMTIHYSDADVTGIDENTLRVVYWTGSTWADMALTCPSSAPYVRDPAGNVIRLTFCHMSEGALVGN